MLSVIKLQSIDYPTIVIYKAFTSDDPVKDFKTSFHDIDFTIIEPTIHQLVNSHGGLDRFTVEHVKVKSTSKADIVREVNLLILEARRPKTWYEYFTGS